MPDDVGSVGLGRLGHIVCVGVDILYSSQTVGLIAAH